MFMTQSIAWFEMTFASQSAATARAPDRPVSRWLKLCAISACLLIPALCTRLAFSALTDFTVWSHLRAGIWILHNLTLPRTPLFSQTIDHPWRDYSWFFDVLLGAGYRLLGLRALVATMMLLQIMTAAMLFWLARGSRRAIWIALSLAGIAQYALWWHKLTPTLASILLYGVELALIFRARASGDARPLRWLPLVFLLWANVDAQFIYGLLVLVLFVFTLAGERFLQAQHAAPILKAALWTLASCLAPLLNPYGYRVYSAALDQLQPSPLSAYIVELNAIPFRRPQEFALLLLTMAAFFVVGRRHRNGIFSFCLMLLTALLAYPSQHRTWLVIVSAVAVIGDSIPSLTVATSKRDHARLKLSTAGLATAIVIAMIVAMPSDRRLLSGPLAAVLPVRACDYIRDTHSSPPLFTSYEWGGFLTWYLPEYPVNIDSRVDAHGGQATLAYFKVTHGEIPLWRDVSFMAARTILLPPKLPMTAALGTVPDFKVAYCDEVATVLVKQQP